MLLYFSMSYNKDAEPAGDLCWNSDLVPPFDSGHVSAAVTSELRGS